MTPFGEYGNCRILRGHLDRLHPPTLGPQNLRIRESTLGRSGSAVTLHTPAHSPPSRAPGSPSREGQAPPAAPPLHSPEIPLELTGCPSPACRTRLHVPSPASFESPASGTPPLTAVTPGWDASGCAAGNPGFRSFSQVGTLGIALGQFLDLLCLQGPFSAQLALSNSPCRRPSFLGDKYRCIHAL